MIGWEHFEHAADAGVRGIGDTLEEAFAGAALAMTALVVEVGAVRPSQPIALHAEAPDEELLLPAFLNAVVLEMSARAMVFSRFEVAIAATSPRALGVEATAWGEPIDRRRHDPKVEVKGATYTALAARRQPDGTWFAQCVVDV